MTRWLSNEEQHAWLAYRRMKGALDLVLARDLAADAGLSEADYDVLSNLSESDDRRRRVKDLAGKMLWSTSRLSHHLSRMQERGLVERHATDADRRGTEVTLTDHGWQVLVEAAPQHVELVRRHLFDLLTPEQVQALDTIATTVLANLDE